MGYKESLFFLVFSSIIILLPILGSTYWVSKKLFFLVKTRRACESNSIWVIKILFLTTSMIYGVVLFCYFFWIIYIARFNVPQSIKIIGILISIPYIFVLFAAVYSLGATVAFGGKSLTNIYNEIEGAKNRKNTAASNTVFTERSKGRDA